MLLIFRGSLTQVLAYLECRAVQLHCKPLYSGEERRSEFDREGISEPNT